MENKHDSWLKEYFRYFYLKLNCFLTTDRQYIKTRYHKVFRQKINLDDPHTFNEKIQYLKLHYHPQILPSLADKYEVRKYIQMKGCEWILNDLIAVYDDPENIDLAALPDSFILKMSHGSGWNIFCRDKTKLEWSREFKRVKRWAGFNYYTYGREWVYQSIKPRIVIEKYLCDSEHETLLDYKFFCFHGDPHFIQVDIDRFTNHLRNLYDLNWQCLPFRYVFPNSAQEIARPSNLEEMVSVAKNLSQDFLFARIDLFSVAGRTFFGEMTFTPENGFGRFFPQEYDSYWGSKLRLENRTPA